LFTLNQKIIKPNDSRSARIFSSLAFIEGISYLVLLGIAMPLKYIFDFPLAVKLVGWAHGVLFVAYCTYLLICWIQYRWTFLRVVGFFIASLIPFLTFWVEKTLRKEYHTGK
jgi:integral membrane protein